MLCYSQELAWVPDLDDLIFLFFLGGDIRDEGEVWWWIFASRFLFIIDNIGTYQVCTSVPVLEQALLYWEGPEGASGKRQVTADMSDI